MSNLTELLEINKKHRIIIKAKKVAEQANNIKPEAYAIIVSEIEKNENAKKLFESLQEQTYMCNQELSLDSYSFSLLTDSYNRNKEVFVSLLSEQVEKKFSSKLSEIKSRVKSQQLVVDDILIYARKMLAGISPKHLEAEITEIMNGVKLDQQVDRAHAQKQIDELKQYANTHATSTDPVIVANLEELKMESQKAKRNLDVSENNIYFGYEKDGFLRNRAAGYPTNNPRGRFFTESYLNFAAPGFGHIFSDYEILKDRTKLR